MRCSARHPRRLMLAAVAAVLLVGLLGTTSVFAVQPIVSINIVDAPRPESKWGFAPTTRKVAVGTWVTWSNAGDEAHTVTADDGAFDSGDLDPGDGFSWYFDQPGTYHYTCTLHTWMTGTIVVGDGAATQPPAPPPADPEPSDDSGGAG